MPSPLTEEKKDYLKRSIFTLYARYGFDGISMDEIAKNLHVGKPTLYKYFKSKEDIVRQIEEMLTGHLDSVALSVDHGIDSVLDGMSKIYRQGIILAAGSKKEYMSDLKRKYPDLYEKHRRALDGVSDRFQEFYQAAMDAGYCRNLSIALVVEQFRRMLPTVISAEYLSENNLTLSWTIREYYRMLLHQVISTEHQYVTDQEANYEFCDALARRLKDTFFYEDDRVK